MSQKDNDNEIFNDLNDEEFYRRMMIICGIVAVVGISIFLILTIAGKISL